MNAARKSEKDRRAFVLRLSTDADVAQRQRALLDKAVLMSGAASLNQFVVNAAIEKAEKVTGEKLWPQTSKKY